jgi:DNA-directed RNA polymerase specialized sigma subunit
MLLSVLRELPADDQLLLRLRFDDGLQAEAIAQLLRFPTRFHVYRRIDQVLHRLRNQLEQKGMHDAS